MTIDEGPAGFTPFMHKFRDTPFWDSMPYSAAKLWMFLLIEVTHNGNAKKRGVEPGMVRHSIRFMRQAMSWIDAKGREKMPALNTIMRDLKALEDEGMVTLCSVDRKYTEITICKDWLYVEKTLNENNSQNNSQNNKLNNVVQVQQQLPSPDPGGSEDDPEEILPEELDPNGSPQKIYIDRMASVYKLLCPKPKNPLPKSMFALFNRWLNTYIPKFSGDKQAARDFILLVVEHQVNTKTCEDFENQKHFVGHLVTVLEKGFDKIKEREKSNANDSESVVRPTWEEMVRQQEEERIRREEEEGRIREHQPTSL